MTADYGNEWQTRFGEGWHGSGETPDLPWLRQVLQRRTHRRFAPRDIPEPLLRLLLGVAFSASSKSDYQQASVIHVVDRNRRDRIAALMPDMPWIASAPVFLVFLGDARRLERLGEMCGHPNDNRRLEGFFNATVDAALALQTFVLAAETAGLGCCPISVLRNHAGDLGEILELPDRVFPVAGLCVGYPAAEGFVSMRLPLAVTVHRDRYDDRDLAEAVAAYDRRRAARYAPPRERQRAPAIFGYAEFYGWSEDKTRQTAGEPEGATFPAYLRRSGFTFD